MFREAHRVLVTDAPLVVGFSNRCFPTRVMAVRRALDTGGHATLVSLYLKRAGFHDIAAHVLADGSRGDPPIAVMGSA